jgi:hypothetical protein
MTLNEQRLWWDFIQCSTLGDSSKGEQMPSKRGGSTSRTTVLVQRAADFEVLLEGVRNALVSAHAAGVIRFINRWKEVLFGRDGSELVAGPPRRLCRSLSAGATWRSGRDTSPTRGLG